MRRGFYIKERHNPQLGVYYVACGQMTKRDARKWESNSIYGNNIMHRFEDADSYRDKIRDLKESGESVQ